MHSNLIERESQDQEAGTLGYVRPDTADPAAVLSLGRAKKPRRFLGWRIVIGLILLAAAFVIGWYANGFQSHENGRLALPEVVQVDTQNRIFVTADQVTQRVVERSIEAVGTLHGFEEITISSKEEGRVLRIHHDLASHVKPGEILLEMDPTDAQLAVQQAERNVQAELAKWGFSNVPMEGDDLSALPTVVSARLKYELAQSRLNRMTQLTGTNTISAEDLEQAQSDALVLESDWKNQLLMANSAAAMARLRNTELAIARQKLHDTQILVPRPTLIPNAEDQQYTITERMVSEGTLLRQGSEVFKLVLGKTLKLKLLVPEVYSSQVLVGQTVEVMTSMTDASVEGSVARVSPAVDRTTRTFQVEVEVPNADSTLKPGSFAKAKILVGVDEKATTIPLAGLYTFAGIHKVFILDQGVAREYKVTLGEQSNDWIEIASPPIPLDSIVITSGQRLLSEGVAVAIRQPTGDAVTQTAEGQESTEAKR